jgi:DNA-binding NarL/FixJ family response regulator
MKQNCLRFILIDDDPFTLACTEKVIRKNNPCAEIIAFAAAKEAMEYMRTEDRETVLLTDLHMPEIDGFALLDQMENTLKDRLHIFVLSSTAWPEDIQRVLSYNCVIGFLSKPLSVEKYEKIMNSIQYP